MTCSRCQREIEADSSFCRYCGAATAAGTSTAASLRRLPSEGKVAGVCAGIAAYLNTDVTLVRLGWVALSIVPGVFIGGLLAYVVAWLFVPEAQPGEVRGYTGKQLLRSTRDKMVGGVCGGLAEYFELDPTVVRVLWVVLSIYPGAVIGGVLAYLIAWYIIPTNHIRHEMSPTTA